MINPQNKDEECFKWAVIAALHHEEIKDYPERIGPLRSCENQYNWKKMDKFEKSNPDIAVNVKTRLAY